MNILLINHYAGSIYHGMEYRPYYLAREWVNQGHRVTVIAASFSHVRSRQPEVKEQICEENIDGIHYVWIRTPLYEGNGLKRAMNIFSFTLQLFFRRSSFLKDFVPNIIIASSTYPLDTIPARLIANQYKARLFYEVHDLWPLSLIELGGMSKYHPFIMLMQLAELFAYRFSDQIVSLLPNAEPHMRAHGLKPRKFNYVPNGIDLAEWKNDCLDLQEELQAFIQTNREQKRFLVCYSGAHGVANDLMTLISAAEGMADEPVSFLLVGKGPEKKKLQAEVQRRNLNNVYFLPPVPKELIPALLMKMDILYIGLKKEPLFRFGVSPNKVMDYMMAGKPIVYAVKSSNNPVSESECGVCIPSSDPLALQQGVASLLALSPSQRLAMGIKGTHYVLERHTYDQLSRKFISIMESKSPLV